MTTEPDIEAQPNRGMNPAALTVAVAARLLSAAGGQAVTVDMIEADVAAGAPTNPDGTINLVHYAAWLVREQAVGPSGCSAVRNSDDARLAPNSLTVEQPNSLRPGGPP
jgi:hypothetical protein